MKLIFLWGLSVLQLFSNSAGKPWGFSSHKLLQTIQFFTGLINLYQKFIFTEFELLARCDIVGFRVHFCPEKVTKHNKSVLQ